MHLAPSDALAASALRFVGHSGAPARSDDGRTVLLTPTTGSATAITASGHVRTRSMPPGCAPRRLRHSRLVLACPANGTEQPAVLNMASGELQTPPRRDPTGATTDAFFSAGRYWLHGLEHDAGGHLIPVVRHRYTGAQYRVWSGIPDLDSPSYRITPSNSAPEPCPARLMTTRSRLTAVVCGRRTLLKRCRSRCYAPANNRLVGAYIERGRLNQITLSSGQVLRRWRVPETKRDRITILLTANAVYISLRHEGAWRVLRAELA